MLKEIEAFTIICDNCGADVNEPCDYAFWNDASYVEDIREDAGWIKLDDKHYCTDCFEYNDNDELTLLT